MANIHSDITGTIGNTPLVRLNRVIGTCAAEVLAKLEYFNPGSSVKDRIGLGMIDAAVRDGKLKPGGLIVEPTSGNTGIGIALVAAARGYKVILTMPESMSVERRKLLALLGVELVLTPAVDGMTGAIARAKEIAKERDAFMPSQFDNPANPATHERTTAEEILRDTDGRVDVLVAGVGTGGSLTGISRRLRRDIPRLYVVAVEPESSPVLSGGQRGLHAIQGIGAGFVPGVLETGLIDQIVTVPDLAAFETARQLAAREGIMAGISSGAAVWAAVRIGMRPGMEGRRIVVILPDTAERYMSTALFPSV